MKNKTFKIVALLAVAAIGIYALNNSRKNKANSSNGLVEAETEIQEIPKTFTIEKDKANETTLVYTFDGKIYQKQLMSPTIRTVPVEITKEEFEAAHKEHLL